jgi:hypothetical protein
MARPRKPIELRTLDDDPAKQPAVIRLDAGPQPVRLIPEHANTPQGLAPRLAVPSVATVENRRSHQPGVEHLIEPEEVNPEDAEENWDKAAAERKPVPWGWFVLVGLLLTGALAWSISQVQQAEAMLKEAQNQGLSIVNASAVSDQQTILTIERMERTLKAFCEASSIDAMLPLVRQPATVRPLMERFYAQHPLHPLGFRKIKTFQGAGLDSKRDFWLFTVVLGNGKTREIMLENDPAGEIRVDWETVVTYQPMNWDDYAAQRPAGTSMEFRVYAETDHFFSHEFANSNRWASFRLTTNEGVETLFGYAPAGEAAAAMLTSIIEQSTDKRAAVILRLSLPDGLQSRRGVIIEKVIGSQWVRVNPPESDP